MRLTKNFLLSEFRLPESARTELNVYKAWRLALILQSARDRVGKPLIITSGYRSPTHNAHVGGAKNSDHLWTDWKAAVDVIVDGNNALERWQAVITIAPRPDFGQLIWYLDTNHFHLSLPTEEHMGELLLATLDPDGNRVYERYDRVSTWSYAVRSRDFRLMEFRM